MRNYKQNPHNQENKPPAKPIEFMPNSLEIDLFGEEFTIFISNKVGKNLIIFHPGGRGGQTANAKKKELS